MRHRSVLFLEGRMTKAREETTAAYVRWICSTFAHQFVLTRVWAAEDRPRRILRFATNVIQTASAAPQALCVGAQPYSIWIHRPASSDTLGERQSRTKRSWHGNSAYFAPGATGTE